MVFIFRPHWAVKSHNKTDGLPFPGLSQMLRVVPDRWCCSWTIIIATVCVNTRSYSIILLWAITLFFSFWLWQTAVNDGLYSLTGSFVDVYFFFVCCINRYIFLFPRILFWTDWDATFPRIEAASMSGGGRHIVFKDMEIGAWPNGLTLDHLEKRIVWTDARLVLIFFLGLLRHVCH